MRRLSWLWAAPAVLAGCAPLGPASSSGPPPSSANPVAVAQATHEYPSPVRTQQPASSTATPVAAVRAFAQAYINWNAATVSADMAALAQASVGQARSAMELAAAQTAQDYELQRGGVANHGTVEAITPQPGAPDTYIVVTLERTTATATAAYEGLQPAWHVALATVAGVGPGGWAVSAWQPQS